MAWRLRFTMSWWKRKRVFDFSVSDCSGNPLPASCKDWNEKRDPIGERQKNKLQSIDKKLIIFYTCDMMK